MSARFAAHPTTVDGYRFASKREARRYGELRLLQLAGEISDLELQPSFPVLINDKPFCTYTADFSYSHKARENHEISAPMRTIEEVKSTGTRRDAAYRLRRKAAELYYNITVTELVA